MTRGGTFMKKGTKIVDIDGIDRKATWKECDTAVSIHPENTFYFEIIVSDDMNSLKIGFCNRDVNKVDWNQDIGSQSCYIFNPGNSGTKTNKGTVKFDFKA